MKRIIYLFLLFPFREAAAQDSTESVTISGYVEIYYAFDFNRPPANNLPSFIYNYNRHNEINLNLGILKANYTAKRVRANLSLGTGTYMNANYSQEPGVLKNIFEANAGIKICAGKELWIDAGVMPSHIGFESAISKDCWTVTRSMLADNSPYFESGARISYTSGNGKWLLSGLVLNGWQRIKKPDGISGLSWGTQVQYKPTSHALLNYSNFIGTDRPDSLGQDRIFHNFYGIFNLSRKLGLTVGFDFGSEEKGGGNGRNNWWSPVIILRYDINGKWSLAGRAEYYNDKNEAIISTGTANGFQTQGYSINLDHTPYKKVMVRTELKQLIGRDSQFARQNSTPSRSSLIFTMLLSVAF